MVSFSFCDREVTVKLNNNITRWRDVHAVKNSSALNKFFFL